MQDSERCPHRDETGYACACKLKRTQTGGAEAWNCLFELNQWIHDSFFPFPAELILGNGDPEQAKNLKRGKGPPPESGP